MRCVIYEELIFIQNKHILLIISNFVYKFRPIKSVTTYLLSGMKISSDVLMFCCRSWVICRWKCWNQWWCGRSWWCMHWTSPDVLRDKRLLCCRQRVGRGIRLWLAGRIHPLHSGWGINWRDWLNVSTDTLCSRLVVISICILVWNQSMGDCRQYSKGAKDQDAWRLWEVSRWRQRDQQDRDAEGIKEEGNGVGWGYQLPRRPWEACARLGSGEFWVWKNPCDDDKFTPWSIKNMPFFIFMITLANTKQFEWLSKCVCC